MGSQKNKKDKIIKLEVEGFTVTGTNTFNIPFDLIIRNILPELTELWLEWANEVHDNVIPNIKNVAFLDYLKEKYDKRTNI